MTVFTAEIRAAELHLIPAPCLDPDFDPGVVYGLELEPETEGFVFEEPRNYLLDERSQVTEKNESTSDIQRS